MNNKFSGNYDYNGIYLMESYDNSITGNTLTKANNGIVLRWGATCTIITKIHLMAARLLFYPDINQVFYSEILIKIIRLT